MSTRRVSEDRRKKDYEPKTDFQRWLKPYLKIGTDEEISTQNLHKRLEGKKLNGDGDYTENYLYRIIRGDPETYPNAARPGWALAFAIGEIVGDTPGAMRAAGYPVPDQKIIRDGDKLIVMGEVYRIIAPDGKPEEVEIDDNIRDYMLFRNSIKKQGQ